MNSTSFRCLNVSFHQVFLPSTGWINNCDGGRSHTYCDYRYFWGSVSLEKLSLGLITQPAGRDNSAVIRFVIYTWMAMLMKLKSLEEIFRPPVSRSGHRIKVKIRNMIRRTLHVVVSVSVCLPDTSSTFTLLITLSCPCFIFFVVLRLWSATINVAKKNYVFLTRQESC
jgi:hypothetical protein